MAMPGTKLVTGALTLVLVFVVVLVLFGPSGMAADFVFWLGGKIGAFFSDLLDHLPEYDSTALGGHS